MSAEPIVACLRWGSAYDSDYLTVLRAAVAARLRREHRFVCVTDDAAGLPPGVAPVALPEIPIDRGLWGKGIWPKLALYKPGVFPAGSLVLFLDLDVLVCGSLDPLVDRAREIGGLHVIREWSPAPLRALPEDWRPHRGANSSVIAWRAGEQAQIWKAFAQDPAGTLRRFRREQDVVDRFASPIHYWPAAWCQSFKRACVWYPPLNRVLPPRPPRGAKVLVFHGKPRPKDLMQAPGSRWGSKRKYGHDPVEWVQEYWRAHGGGLPAT